MTYNIDYHITDKCNLNCAHCSHFCSLVPANAKHKSIEEITADLALVSRISKTFINLAIMGGEPTLHPQLSKILYIARKFLPNNRISLTTNATMADKFLQWKDAILDNDIDVVVTVYPYKKDVWENYYKIRQIIPNTTSWIYPTEFGFTYHQLSNKPGLPTKEQIMGCYKRWRCLQLKDGKLWICHYAAQLNRLKDAFPGQVNIDVDDKCYIDLHNSELTDEDVILWQNNTHPAICDHCADVAYGAYDSPYEPWRISEHKLEEWVE